MRTAKLEPIADGTPGVKVKVRRIRELVEKAKRDPHFRDKVAALVQHVAEKDHDREIETLVEHVRGGIRYLRDPWSPVGLELFIEAETMLQDVEAGTAAGDCDDHVILASALLETAGYRTRYRIGGVPPDHWKHIWLDVEHPKRGWLPVELTQKQKPIGWDPSPRFPLTATLGEPMPRLSPLELELKRKGISPRAWMMQAGRPGSALSTEVRSLPKPVDPVAGTTYQQRWRRAQESIVRSRTGAVAPRASTQRQRRMAAAQRRGVGHRGGTLGELPPSFYNTHPVAYSPVPWGSTPADFLRAVDRGDAEPMPFTIGQDAEETFGLGFLKKLKKLHKKHRKVFKKVLKKGAKASPVLKLFRKKKRPPGAPQPVPAPGVVAVQPATGVIGVQPVGGAVGFQPYTPAPYTPAMPLPGQPLYTGGAPGYVSALAPTAPMPASSGSYMPTDWDFPYQQAESFDVEPAYDDASETYDPDWGVGVGPAGPIEYYEEPMEYGTFGGADWAEQIGLGEDPAPWWQSLLQTASGAATAALRPSVKPAAAPAPTPWWQSLLQTAGQVGTELVQARAIRKGYLPPAAAPPPPPPPPPMFVQAPPPPPPPPPVQLPPQIIFRDRPEPRMQAAAAPGGMMAMLPWIAGGAALLLLLRK